MLCVMHHTHTRTAHVRPQTSAHYVTASHHSSLSCLPPSPLPPSARPPQDITSLKALRNPPDVIKRIFDCVLLLRWVLGEVSVGAGVSAWFGGCWGSGMVGAEVGRQSACSPP